MSDAQRIRRLKEISADMLRLLDEARWLVHQAKGQPGARHLAEACWLEAIETAIRRSSIDSDEGGINVTMEDTIADLELSDEARLARETDVRRRVTKPSGAPPPVTDRRSEPPTEFETAPTSPRFPKSDPPPADDDGTGRYSIVAGRSERPVKP